MRDIPGYEGLYAATSCGRIWSYRAKRFIKGCGEEGNYQQLLLWKDGKSKCCYVHRLVAMAFLENNDQLPEVDHINRKKDDNRLCNLHWSSVADNRKNRGTWKKINKNLIENL